VATRAEYLAWARVMSREFRALCDANRAGTPTVLDRYGATNPAEFFAVATEAFFFESPRVLRARHPELYAEFAHFFGRIPFAILASLLLLDANESKCPSIQS